LPFVYQARREGIGGVRFVGYVSEHDKLRYLHSCDVCCVPSTGFESFGIVLLEAMAAGRPLVASNIPGYRSVLTHGREGLLVEPGDPQALAAALIDLLRNPELRSRMGAQGMETARGFAWDKVAARVLDYYRALLEEKGIHPHDQ
jgi:phosphatidylinositol alpha-mannosyltransferase